MARDWESTFRGWASPPSETEQTKCENAERGIRAAIAASNSLNRRNIEVFTQGSYRNNTNVRLDSDVDVCVRLMDVLFDDYSLSNGLTRADVGVVPAEYTYAQFKNDVGKALVDHFGASSVTRGNKAFDVHANTYRVDADVVAAFEHRRYMRSGGGYYYLSGTELRPDNGGKVINWPHQHAANGIAKNNATGRRFKAMVRLIKRLRNEMNDQNIAAARPIASYLIECLVWNVPNDGFGHATYTQDVRYILAHLYNGTRSDETCTEWGEISELKYLFRGTQPWTRVQANDFLSAAWRHVGFE